MGKGERFKENKNSILTKKFIIKNIISFVLFIFFLTLFIISGIKVINYVKDARNNKELYEELAHFTIENEDNTRNLIDYVAKVQRIHELITTSSL